jgi:hypothetical protein
MGVEPGIALRSAHLAVLNGAAHDRCPPGTTTVQPAEPPSLDARRGGTVAELLAGCGAAGVQIVYHHGDVVVLLAVRLDRAEMAGRHPHLSLESNLLYG